MGVGVIADPPPTSARSPYLSEPGMLNLWFSLHKLGRAGNWHVSLRGATRTLCGKPTVRTKNILQCEPPTCPNCIRVLDKWDREFYR